MDEDILYKSDNIIIFNSCIETIPCYHTILINGEYKELSSTQIADLLRSFNEPIPTHFDEDDNIVIGIELFP